MDIVVSGQPETPVPLPRLAIVDFRPDKAFYKPGQPVRLLVRLQTNQPFKVELHLKVTYLAETVNKLVQRFNVIEAGQIAEASFVLNLAPETPRGYGFDLTVKTGNGATVLAAASTATDVLSGWPQMPRYGFFANFKAEESATESASRAWALSAYHVNVVQFYDWMYRHDDFIPPQDDFIDPMGRTVSLATVRHKIEAAHRLNMAALAYGAVYGATPAFWETHQDWGLYTEDGEPFSLEKLFYQMNISANNPWHDHILTQYDRALSQLDFDGIHMDQYGAPYIAYDKSTNPDQAPQKLDLSQLFPLIIDEAARRAAQLKPDGTVIFNAVNNWPIETVATTDQAALYIEVWAPFVDYKDLYELVVNARRLANSAETGKQVILAAYLLPFLPAETPSNPAQPENVEGAQNSALLATATIYASGGFHLLLGEDNGALTEAYYPSYGHFQPDFVLQMRRYYDFVVRYENILSAPDLMVVPVSEVTQQLEIRSAGNTIEISGEGKAGQVWAIMRRGPAFTSLNLVNLTGLSNSLWNAFKETPTDLTDLEITLNLPVSEASAIKKVWLTSPDSAGTAQELTFEREELAGNRQKFTLLLPRLAYWSLLVLENETGV